MSEPRDITKEIWSEAALAELLGANKRQLRRLTLVHGMPTVRLQTGLYVFKAAEVLAWIESKRSLRHDDEDTAKSE